MGEIAWAFDVAETTSPKPGNDCIKLLEDVSNLIGDKGIVPHGGGAEDDDLLVGEMARVFDVAETASPKPGEGGLKLLKAVSNLIGDTDLFYFVHKSPNPTWAAVVFRAVVSPVFCRFDDDVSASEVQNGFSDIPFSISPFKSRCNSPSLEPVAVLHVHPKIRPAAQWVLVSFAVLFAPSINLASASLQGFSQPLLSPLLSFVF